MEFGAKSPNWRLRQDRQVCHGSFNSSHFLIRICSLAPSDPQEEENVADPKPLRPLTSLNWPYVPEESAYPDPLKRDDPKPLQLPQYEAIGELRKPICLDRSLRLTQLRRLKSASVTRTDIERQQGPEVQLPEDVVALRALAEAVEVAVRGGKQDALGLDWDNE
ncbi:hypothetical protein EYR40_006276 [Pleurotus pulmonarius]|nr:hypothetical protein EYR40_006276 [Pleurotus pulmonarius]